MEERAKYIHITLSAAFSRAIFLQADGSFLLMLRYVRSLNNNKVKEFILISLILDIVKKGGFPNSAI